MYIHTYLPTYLPTCLPAYIHTYKYVRRLLGQGHGAPSVPLTIHPSTYDPWPMTLYLTV